METIIKNKLTGLLLLVLLQAPQCSAAPVSSSSRPSLLWTKILNKRASNDDNEGDFSHGAIAGTIIGLVCAVLVFLTVAITVFRHRARNRRINRATAMHLHPGVRKASMANYARAQEARIRRSQARIAESRRPSEYSERRGRAFGGYPAPPSTQGYSPSPGPPPSYKATVQTPAAAAVRR